MSSPTSNDVRRDEKDVEAALPLPEVASSDPTAAPPASSPDVDDSPQPPAKPVKVKIVFPCLILCMFLAALDQTIVSTALPTIAAELNASSSEYSWVGTSYMLLTATLTPCYGRLSDLLGRKSILYISISIFIVSSALCGAAQDIRWLIACRAFQGIGGGGIMSMTSILVGDVVPFGERGKYQGYLGGVWGVASVLGPILGGLLTDRASWRWTFWINLPTCVSALLILFFALRLPEHPRATWPEFRRQFDWTGLALLAAGLACIVVAFEQATDHGFGYKPTIALIVVGASLLCISVAYFLKTTKRGIIPARIFRTRTTGGLMIVSYLQAFCFLSAAFYLPNWWQSIKGVSATMSGVHLLPFSLGVSFISLPTGWYISKYGRVRSIIRIGYATAALGFGLMNLMDQGSSLAINEIFPCIAALGVGMSLQPPLIMLQAAMPLGDMAATASSFMLVRSLGATTGISIVGSVLSTRQSKLMSGVAGYDYTGVPSTKTEFQAIHDLQPASLQQAVLGALAESFHTIFNIYVGIFGVCLLISFVVRHYSVQEQYVPRSERAPVLAAPPGVVLPVPTVGRSSVETKDGSVDIGAVAPATPASEATLSGASDREREKVGA